MLICDKISNSQGAKSHVVTAAQTGIKVDDANTDEGESMTQRLDYETWLPYAAKLYRIDPDIKNYYLVTVPICPSDIPNRNGIGFPLAELLKFQAPPVARMAYKAWSGCPVHYEHANEVHEDAYGVILDTHMHQIKGFASDKLWTVMGMLAIDKNKYPEIARRIKEKDLNTYSMGALVDSFTCSYCNTPLNAKGYPGCSHVGTSKEINWRRTRDHSGRDHIAFLNAHGINPIECSAVETPAWSTALSDNVIAMED